MKITIGNPIIRDKPKSVYVLTIQTMEGDGDSYNEHVKYMKTEDEVKQTMLLLEEVMFYSPDECSEDILLAFKDCFEGGWHSDTSGWYDSYESHELVYFDAEGIEHSVNIEI